MIAIGKEAAPDSHGKTTGGVTEQPEGPGGAQRKLAKGQGSASH